MLIEIYILLCIISFVLFIFVLMSPSFLPDDSVANLWVLPVIIIMFSALFFASFNLTTSTTITSAQNVSMLSENTSRTVYEYTTSYTYFRETAFAWMFLALGFLNLIIFLWEVWKQAPFYKGD